MWQDQLLKRPLSDIDEGGGGYQTSRNHLTQPKHGKQFLNNVTDTGKIEMQKNKGIVEIMKQVHITK